MANNLGKWLAPAPLRILSDRTLEGVLRFGDELVAYLARMIGALANKLNRLVELAEPPTLAQTVTFSAEADRFYVVDSTAGNVTVNLPVAADSRGVNYIVFKTVLLNSVILDPAGAELINGAATLTLTPANSWAWCFCDGTGWWALT